MLQEILSELYERDLKKLKTEIEQYPNEGQLWEKPGDVPNSAGNLCLHLNGNLQHFFGAILGGSGYVRNRDHEFSAGFVPRQQMLDDIDKTISVVRETLAELSDDDLERDYPIEVFGAPITTKLFITHLALHLNWHLGQINYHRRMVE